MTLTSTVPVSHTAAVSSTATGVGLTVIVTKPMSEHVPFEMLYSNDAGPVVVVEVNVKTPFTGAPTVPPVGVPCSLTVDPVLPVSFVVTLTSTVPVSHTAAVSSTATGVGLTVIVTKPGSNMHH